MVMEEAFDTLKKHGKNNVNGLIHWMTESDIIDGTKVTEEKARSLFDNVRNKDDVDLASFKQALAKLAEEQAVSQDDYVKALVDKFPTWCADHSCPKLMVPSSKSCCQRSQERIS